MQSKEWKKPVLTEIGNMSEIVKNGLANGKSGPGQDGASQEAMT